MTWRFGRWRWAAIGLMAMVAFEAGAVTCRLTCPSTTVGGVCKIMDGGEKAFQKPALNLQDCEKPDRKALTPLIVWFAEKKMLTFKEVAANTELKSALTTADRGCGSLFDCLFPAVLHSPKAGMPMGQHLDDTQTTGAKAGLPHGTVFMPAQGLPWRTLTPQGDGVLKLFDAQSGRVMAELPVKAGTSHLPASVLEAGEAYRYEWQAGGALLEGRFELLFDGEVQKLEESYQKRLAQGQLDQADAWLARAAALAEAHCDWNAQQMMRLHTSTETAP